MESAEIRKYYEDLYGSGSRKLSNNLKRIKQNLSKFPVLEGEKILDIGCGFGMLLHYLSQKGCKPVGIDLSFYAALYSKRGNALTLQTNSEHLPFRAQSFDKATFMGTLEHFPHPGAALREAKRVLKNGAKVCIVVPNRRFPSFRFFQGTRQIYENPMTLEEWSSLFSSNGFSVETVYKDQGPGLLDRGLAGIVKKLFLVMINLFPLKHTYQFVFICRAV